MADRSPSIEPLTLKGWITWIGGLALYIGVAAMGAVAWYAGILFPILGSIAVAR
jgi:membrane protein implicated in regulation of membrane protease activity